MLWEGGVCVAGRCVEVGGFEREAWCEGIGCNVPAAPVLVRDRDGVLRTLLSMTLGTLAGFLITLSFAISA